MVGITIIFVAVIIIIGVTVERRFGCIDIMCHEIAIRFVRKTRWSAEIWRIKILIAMNDFLSSYSFSIRICEIRRKIIEWNGILTICIANIRRLVQDTAQFKQIITVIGICIVIAIQRRRQFSCRAKQSVRMRMTTGKYWIAATIHITKATVHTTNARRNATIVAAAATAADQAATNTCAV